MHRGYIKLWRKSVENPLYFSEPFTKWQAWQDLILIANHGDRYANFRGINILIKRGQAAGSSQWLADRWRWKTRGKVARFLDFMEESQQIIQQKTNVTNLITIINYDKYHADDTADDTASEQQVNSKRTPSEQQTDTPKNVNNVDNEKKVYSDDFESFWKSYPKKIGKGGAFNAWKKSKGKPELSDIIGKIEEFAKSDQWKRDGGQYVPNAQTWINERRWDDEVQSLSESKKETTLEDLM